MNRRDFLQAGGLVLAGTAGAYALPLLGVYQSAAGSAHGSGSGRKWGMVIDVTKCKKDCTLCVEACKAENNVADLGDKRWDVHLIRKVTLKRKDVAGAEGKPVPLLCNHCDHPPCAQACPVKATYKRHDGIVICDHHRCIGCRYCMIACPYNARHFNYKEDHDWPNKDQIRSAHGVPQSCNFCAHIIDRDKDAPPACVSACPEGAIVVGDLNDPADPVSTLIAKKNPSVIREDLGTKPKVYYIGL
jgi:molybdopterin-containing oxidoreductase family iron-sulfur binding subunit